MKNKIAITLSIISLGLFVKCSGDHSTHVVRDTEANQYHVPKNQTQDIDTSKVTTTTGDASNIDNSGSGGTKIDTAKHKNPKDNSKKQ
jgi:hypothetical protein